MPKKSNAELEGRLTEVRERVEAELLKIEDRRVELKNLIGTLQYVQDGQGEQQAQTKRGKMSLSARRKIAKVQRARWRKLKKAGKAGKHSRAANAAMPQWTDKDDALIVQAAKAQGPVEAPALAKELHAKLSGRSEGAIRQRISRLAHRGMLRQHAAIAGQGVPRRMLVEAA